MRARVPTEFDFIKYVKTTKIKRFILCRLQILQRIQKYK